jgi:hypothetical protein
LPIHDNTRSKAFVVIIHPTQGNYTTLLAPSLDLNREDTDHGRNLSIFIDYLMQSMFYTAVKYEMEIAALFVEEL